MAAPASADETAELGYDTTNLRALQEQLRQLNAAAHAEGLLGRLPARGGQGASAPAGQAVRNDGNAARNGGKATRDGKAAARRLLAMGGRLDDDDSPDVPGTGFTEAGVVRLLAHMRRIGRREGAWSRFLARMESGLSLPVSSGRHVVAGVALSRLQTVARQLAEIEAHGLAHLVARRRRGRVSEDVALMLGSGVPPLSSRQGEPS